MNDREYITADVYIIRINIGTDLFPETCKCPFESSYNINKD